MIKAEILTDIWKVCDECNQESPFVIQYTFWEDIRSVPYFTLNLCEDCSNGLRNLHYCCAVNEKSHTFDRSREQELAEVAG